MPGQTRWLSIVSCQAGVASYADRHVGGDADRPYISACDRPATSRRIGRVPGDGPGCRFTHTRRCAVVVAIPGQAVWICRSGCVDRSPIMVFMGHFAAPFLDGCRVVGNPIPCALRVWLTDEAHHATMELTAKKNSRLSWTTGTVQVRPSTCAAKQRTSEVVLFFRPLLQQTRTVGPSHGCYVMRYIPRCASVVPLSRYVSGRGMSVSVRYPRRRTSQVPVASS